MTADYGFLSVVPPLLTLAAVTAFAVVAGREPAVDLSPYRPERF
jgi:hypothetical protein